MTQTHTPTPYYVGTETVEQHNGDSYEVYSIGYHDEGKLDYSNSDPFQEIAGDIMKKEDAAFIVRACNSHDALVDAAQEILKPLPRLNPGAALIRREKALQAALALAEGK